MPSKKKEAIADLENLFYKAFQTCLNKRIAQVQKNDKVQLQYLERLYRSEQKAIKTLIHKEINIESADTIWEAIGSSTFIDKLTFKLYEIADKDGFCKIKDHTLIPSIFETISVHSIK